MATVNDTQKFKSKSGKAIHNRDRLLFWIKLLAKLQIVFIILDVALVLGASVYAFMEKFQQASPYLYCAFACVMNMVAGILFLLGVRLTKAELIYTYMCINAFWAVIIFGLITLFHTTDHNHAPNAAFTIAIVVYAIVNILVVIAALILILSIKKVTKTLSISGRRSVSILSKTETITEGPLKLSGKGKDTGTDTSVTEATLKFNESVHGN